MSWAGDLLTIEDLDPYAIEEEPEDDLGVEDDTPTPSDCVAGLESGEECPF